MFGLPKAIALLSLFTAFSIIPEAAALGFPLRPAAKPATSVLNYVHGDHCERRYSRTLGWHRHSEACNGSLQGWCWLDVSGNQFCIGDIRRRDPNECRSNPYALGCRTEHWDNR